MNKKKSEETLLASYWLPTSLLDEINRVATHSALTEDLKAVRKNAGKGEVVRRAIRIGLDAIKKDFNIIL